jgi:hypothetical protein
MHANRMLLLIEKNRQFVGETWKDERPPSQKVVETLKYTDYKISCFSMQFWMQKGEQRNTRQLRKQPRSADRFGSLTNFLGPKSKAWYARYMPRRYCWFWEIWDKLFPWGQASKKKIRGNTQKKIDTSQQVYELKHQMVLMLLTYCRKRKKKFDSRFALMQYHRCVPNVAPRTQILAELLPIHW